MAVKPKDWDEHDARIMQALRHDLEACAAADETKVEDAQDSIEETVKTLLSRLRQATEAPTPLLGDPKFRAGELVNYKVTAKVGKIELEKWVPMHIVGMHLTADNERVYWTYTLSNDPPGPWHNGEVCFSGAKESELFAIPPGTEPRGKTDA